MYFLRPVNILTVTRFRFCVVAALVTFWATFFTFFYAPMWGFIVSAILHLMALFLAVSYGYKLCVFVFLSKEGEGAPPSTSN